MRQEGIVLMNACIYQIACHVHTRLPPFLNFGAGAVLCGGADCERVCERVRLHHQRAAVGHAHRSLHLALQYDPSSLLFFFCVFLLLCFSSSVFFSLLYVFLLCYIFLLLLFFSSLVLSSLCFSSTAGFILCLLFPIWL